MRRLEPIGYFIIALLVLLPFGIWGTNVHFGHAHTLILFCLIGLGILLPNWYLRLFVFYIVAWLTYSLVGLFLGFLTSKASMTLVLIDGSLWFILAAVIFTMIYYSNIENNIIFNAICISATIQAMLGILQHFGLDPVFSIARSFIKVTSDLAPNVSVGTLGNPNFLAAYVAISLPFFFRRRWIYAIPLLVYCLVVTKTTTAVVAAIAGTVFYLWGYREFKLRRIPVFWVSCGMLMTAGIYYAFFYHSFINHPRLDYWLDGIQRITQSWRSIIFGFGPTAEWRIGDKIHNEYIMTLFNFGVVGLALLIGYIITIYRTNKILFTAFIVLCVNAIGNHVLHTIPTALLAITICALIERERCHEKD